MSVRILSDNYVDSSVVASTTVSSEQSAFPSSNAFNFQRRSKVWRSNGYWEITASNNTLVFRETTGVDLTATLTIGSYSSTTALFTEIKTQMETVGGSTYTIEKETNTNKVKFTSNGVGGGGIFEMYWSTSTGLASILGFKTTEDDTGALSYVADQLKIHTSEWFLWDMGISTLPKAFVLAGPRNEPIRISPSATLKLQGSETDSWASPSYEQTLTYNDSVISLFSDEGLHTEALRYWRLEIVDQSNSNGYIEVGVLFLGDYLIQSRGAVQFPFTNNHIDRSPTVFSEGGQTFSDIREKTEGFDIEWFGLTKDEKEAIDLQFFNAGTSKPFFIDFDPNAAFGTSKYYIRYVKYESEPRFRLVSPNNFTCTMSLREEL